jgi:hypothetical protein
MEGPLSLGFSELQWPPFCAEAKIDPQISSIFVVHCSLVYKLPLRRSFLVVYFLDVLESLYSVKLHMPSKKFIFFRMRYVLQYKVTENMF